MQAVTPFPLVEVSGSPHARGRQHGLAVPDRIRGSIKLYAAQLLDLGLSWARIRSLAEEFIPRMEAFGPAMVEELRGIAEGAGQDLAAIVLINARTELLQLGQRGAGVIEEEPEGCTGAILLPEATKHGRLIHGQNWDWRAECADSSIVLKVRREDGPDLLTFTEAGALARSGLNAAGIAITANYLESDRDYRSLGVPLPLIRRRVLESEHYALALKAVATTPKSGSNNMMVSHAEGFGIDLECAPDEAFAIQAPDNGILVHANHWESPAALAKVKDTGIAATPDSLYRGERVRRALKRKHGKLTREDLKQALFDDFCTPFAVCRPPRPNAQGNLSATVAMVIMEPAEGLLELAPLPAVNRSFTAYRLEPQRRRDAA